MKSQEQRLQEMLDKQEIVEQIYNYGRSMDRLDHALGKAVFHPEAVADYGKQMYQGTGWGFVDMALGAHLGYLAHSHQFSNILIQVAGDAATSETYGDVTLRRRDADGGLHDSRNLGRYVDRWTRRDGVWRIIARKYVHDFDQSGPAVGAMFETEGRRDRQDAGYFPET
jgi:hypothetical protein